MVVDHSKTFGFVSIQLASSVMTLLPIFIPIPPTATTLIGTVARILHPIACDLEKDLLFPQTKLGVRKWDAANSGQVQNRTHVISVFVCP
jgi:hypothetical protein